MDMLSHPLKDDNLPSLTCMSGGEISNAQWTTKLHTVDEGEERKKSTATKVVSKARRLTKAMWGTRIKEARHTTSSS